jgi:hypothetical protein
MAKRLVPVFLILGPQRATLHLRISWLPYRRTAWSRIQSLRDFRVKHRVEAMECQEEKWNVCAAGLSDKRKRLRVDESVREESCGIER